MTESSWNARPPHDNGLDVQSAILAEIVLEYILLVLVALKMKKISSKSPSDGFASSYLV